MSAETSALPPPVVDRQAVAAHFGPRHPEVLSFLEYPFLSEEQRKDLAHHLLVCVSVCTSLCSHSALCLTRHSTLSLTHTRTQKSIDVNYVDAVFDKVTGE